ncbi:MAG: MBL fold metallo-hydrolase [Nitrospirae bacterium]|nr:MBL fold metallo-hydrolase [Nitrospirota bacterium]
MTQFDPVDIARPVEVVSKIHWVGAVDAESPFKCNPYLLDDGDEAVLFEPGSLLAYPGVLQKVIQTLPLPKIRYIVLSHQDPDLCGSLSEWGKVLNPARVQVVTHSRTAVLLRHYGASFPFYLVDQMNWTLRLSSGRELRFLFAPWCHCPGTFMTHDAKSRSLFSGDIFGAITYDWTLYAGEHYAEAMRSFHEDYMASTHHLLHALSKLPDLAIDRILPQHGSIIHRDVPRFIEALQSYRCGIDLLVGSEPSPASRWEGAPKRSPEGEGQEEYPPSGMKVPVTPQKGYRDILAMVIEREIGVLGLENTLSAAREIDGLEVDDRGNLVGFFENDGPAILLRLLALLERRYGHWAVLNCRLMLHDLFREYGLEIPSSLKRSVTNGHS